MGINVNKTTGLKINPSNQINIFNDSNSGDFYNIIESTSKLLKMLSLVGIGLLILLFSFFWII